MKTPAAKSLCGALVAAPVLGCFRKAGIWLWEAVLCGPLPRPRPSIRPESVGLAAVVALLLLPMSGAFGAAATLTVQNAAVPPGAGSLTVPVALSVPAGCAVAALQFDVEFDPAMLALATSGGVLEGAAAKAAGKQLSFSKLSPDKIRVLVVGLNADVIAGGEVAKLNFTVSGGEVSAKSAVQVRNAVLADPNGSQVAVQTGGGEMNAGPIPAPDSAPGISHALPLAAVALLLGCLVAGGMAARFARRRHVRARNASENCRKRSPARCAAQRHG